MDNCESPNQTDGKLCVEMPTLPTDSSLPERDWPVLETNDTVEPSDHTDEHPEHVEMAVADSPLVKTKESVELTVCTDEQPGFVATAAAADLQLSNYPWKNKLSIKVHHLKDTDIDIWCNKTQNYYRFKPVNSYIFWEVKTQKKSPRTYP